MNIETVRAELAKRRAARVYPMPGAPAARIGIRLLTEAELEAARVQAQRNVRKLAGADPVGFVDLDPGYLDRERMIQVLAVACTDPESTREAEPEVFDRHGPRPFFPGADDLRELDTAIVERLFDLYLEHQGALAVGVLPAVELDDALAKLDDVEAAAIAYTSPALRKLLARAVTRLGAAATAAPPPAQESAHGS